MPALAKSPNSNIKKIYSNLNKEYITGKGKQAERVKARFILLGISYKLKVLVVCHCFRENDSIIRIISARKADKDEEYEYWRDRK